MQEQIADLLQKLGKQNIQFSDVLSFIDSHYIHSPTAFKNGETYNKADQNQGSAKVFSFAQMNNLAKAETLQLFAEHYQSVIDHPEATDHQNIRQFMANGWAGIAFEGVALAPKS